MNSGFMLVQYTAASLVSESKGLAHPASVDSIPSSAGQEDHVSMGMTSARRLRDCVANAEVVVALEVLAAAQGIDLRAPLRPGPGTGAARDAVREVVPFLREDRPLKADVDAVVELVQSGALVESVQAVVGDLH
jgi:histidine ammonia-lyase